MLWERFIEMGLLASFRANKPLGILSMRWLRKLLKLVSYILYAMCFGNAFSRLYFWSPAMTVGLIIIMKVWVETLLNSLNIPSSKVTPITTKYFLKRQSSFPTNPSHAWKCLCSQPRIELNHTHSTAHDMVVISSMSRPLALTNTHHITHKEPPMTSINHDALLVPCRVCRLTTELEHVTIH